MRHIYRARRLFYQRIRTQRSSIQAGARLEQSKIARESAEQVLIGATSAPSAMETPSSEPTEQLPHSVAEEGDTAVGVDASKSGSAVTDPTPSVAQNAYRLLHDRRVPSAVQSDGTFDGAALDAWMEAMGRDAAASGHLEIAMTMAGHVLTHVPADPDGLWIDRSAAAILNARDAGDLREGFRTETYHSRGVH